MSSVSGPYADLHAHIAALDEAGLLIRVDEPVNKDTELHPLVRWQFRGGLKEAQRRAFLFTHVVDGKGRRYDFPVLVGALAANAEIYRLGLNAKTLADIGPLWTRAIASPIPPVEVLQTLAPCQEIVVTGDELRRPGGGLAMLPAPISTPGFDVAPYLTGIGLASRDPESLAQNLGTYRGCLKANDRLGVMMSSVSGGIVHWRKYKALGLPMPAAYIVGGPPLVSYVAPQKLPQDADELAVAGALAGQAIKVVRCRTIDLLVPAEAEFVIEGLIRTDQLEPEGPFGESHGHIALEEYSFVMDVTAITHRRAAVFQSIISQVTPSESSVIKRVAYEPMFLNHLRQELGLRGVKRVFMHEPLTNLRPVIILQVAADMPATEVWRALNGVSSYQAGCGKLVIAVNDDIDPENGDALLWALAYRCNPQLDTLILPHRTRGHGPRTDQRSDTDSALLIDATRKAPTPPLALPQRQYMENARQLWERLGLPELHPQEPWFGSEKGTQWSDTWTRLAQAATSGDWIANGLSSANAIRGDVVPGHPVEYDQ